jgi:hypothetical protein
MDIDISDTAPEQSVTIDEMQYFRIGGDASTGQTQQGIHHDLAMTEITQSKFTQNERMRENHSGIEQVGEHLITRAKMIDPYRGVDQDHLELGRRRGGAPAKSINRSVSESECIDTCVSGSLGILTCRRCQMSRQ